MKKFCLSLLAVLLSLPSFAVFNEEDLSKTLNVLRFELKEEVDKRPMQEEHLDNKDINQHRELINITKKCNELSLMLYSQSQDYTFDQTYALKEVTREYEEFNRRRLPFDEIITRLDLEIERYSRLLESLRRLPPQLKEIKDLPDSLAYHNDSLSVFINDMETESSAAFYLDEKGQEDRDSCVVYATTLLKMYSAAKNHIVADSEYYEEANSRLKESYDYAQERYRELQRRIFMGGQDDYFSVIKHFPRYCQRAAEDAARKYSRRDTVSGSFSDSEWRGPMVLSFLVLMLLYLVIAVVVSRLAVSLLTKKVKMFKSARFKSKLEIFTIFCGIVVFAFTNCIFYVTTENNFFRLATGLLIVLSWLLSAIVASVLIRNDGKQANMAIRLYLPLIIVGIVIIAFRIAFIPNTVMNLVFSPILLGFSIWQFAITFRAKGLVSSADMAIAWASSAILAISTIMSWAGFVLLGIQVLIWWLFQVAAIETVMVMYLLLKMYDEKYLSERKKEYSDHVAHTGATDSGAEYIRVTWFYDFLRKTVVPVFAVLSLPLTVYLALNVFDLTDVYDQMLYTTFFDLVDSKGGEMLKISLYMIVWATSLFFLFRYLCYAAKAFYRDVRLHKIMQASGKSYVHTNEVNLTLANNVISILVWGTYIIITIILLRIPTGAVSIIAAGLATGLGLAMKDILNNFIYGIQLMSGRLRVGDWMECDDVRGKVTSISYQSTQMETTDGAVMSFLNTALFNKNFKNLTRNNDYEFVKIVVGVAYGTDVEKARNLLLEAVTPLQTKDRFNRNIIDLSKGVNVVLDEFGDNSVDIAIKQYVLVAERNSYIAMAKEAIYNTLNGNGISIPFPQRDIHIVKES